MFLFPSPTRERGILVVITVSVMIFVAPTVLQTKYDSKRSTAKAAESAVVEGLTPKCVAQHAL